MWDFEYLPFELGSVGIKADGEETRQSSYNSIVCESRRQGLFSRQSTQQQEQSAGPSTGQEAVSKAHGLTGLRPSYSLRWFNFAKHFSEKEGDSVFNTMTSATIFNPNNCAHEQLFKASGLVEANIATTVTKDNICASGKEGFREMTRQTHTY